jgi:hypothetical protein
MIKAYCTKKYCSAGHPMNLSLTVKVVRWMCRRDGCEVKNVNTGTWLQGTYLPYDTIYLFVYSWAQELTSVKFAIANLGFDLRQL